MVTHPVIGSISNMLFNFNSSSQGYIESFPQLQVPSGIAYAQCWYLHAVSDAHAVLMASAVRHRVQHPAAWWQACRSPSHVSLQPSSLLVCVLATHDQ